MTNKYKIETARVPDVEGYAKIPLGMYCAGVQFAEMQITSRRIIGKHNHKLMKYRHCKTSFGKNY